MIKNIHFVIDENNNRFEVWVNGECITDCYSMDEEGFDLMTDLVKFANIPLYREVSIDNLEKERVVKII